MKPSPRSSLQGCPVAIFHFFEFGNRTALSDAVCRKHQWYLMEARCSILTPAQRRALKATAGGEVKRTGTRRHNVINCPKVGSKAIWKLLKHRLVENGQREGDVVTMTLTSAGEQALREFDSEPPSP